MDNVCVKFNLLLSVIKNLTTNTIKIIFVTTSINSINKTFITCQIKTSIKNIPSHSSNRINISLTLQLRNRCSCKEFSNISNRNHILALNKRSINKLENNIIINKLHHHRSSREVCECETFTNKSISNCEQLIHNVNNNIIIQLHISANKIKRHSHLLLNNEINNIHISLQQYITTCRKNFSKILFNFTIKQTISLTFRHFIRNNTLIRNIHLFIGVILISIICESNLKNVITRIIYFIRNSNHIEKINILVNTFLNKRICLQDN